MRAVVTGGAGFIGSALCARLMASGVDQLTVIDKLTYAANPASLAPFADDPRFSLVEADICDAEAMVRVVREAEPDVVFHLAAETHVDRSIDGAGVFVETNVVGTFSILQAARAHFELLKAGAAARFRFVHVSTDEVFGSLAETGKFSETTPYDPSSPYSATKAGADHLVRAWHRTYGLPVIISNCSNNYGPRQFPEKLIPLMVLNALTGLPLPIYGTGLNVRDWLHVDDHADALIRMAQAGAPGDTYTVGGGSDMTNLAVVNAICDRLDQRRPDAAPHKRLIKHVDDRPGHDFRYSIDHTRISSELGWHPRIAFAEGLASTVDWYLDNAAWWRPLRQGVYSGERLGAPGTLPA